MGVNGDTGAFHGLMRKLPMKQEKPFTGFSGRFRGPLGKGKITYAKTTF
jgi:hypothetical protein